MTDPLGRALANTCFKSNAEEVASLFKNMMSTYPEEADGGPETKEISNNVKWILPKAIKRIGDSMYTLKINKKNFVLTWQSHLARGSYNNVYKAKLTDGKKTHDVVVKTSTLTPSDMRVYFLENVLHAIICGIPVMSPLVVPFRFAFREDLGGYPDTVYGAVLDNPGNGDLGKWMESDNFNDVNLCAVLMEIAYMLHIAQQGCQFEHRDFRVDNIMTSVNSSSKRIRTIKDRTYEYPTGGISCYFIDFGMTRIMLENSQYVACDCMQPDSKFNPSHDLQSLICTINEDYNDELSESARKMRKWIRNICNPIYGALYAANPDYDDLERDDRVHILTEQVRVSREPDFEPYNVFRSLSKFLDKHWR